MYVYNDKVICPDHGEQQAAYVCRHLAESIRTGKVVGYYCSDSTDVPRPDAWCARCDKKLLEAGKWNDETLNFAGITLICGKCYDIAKSINTN